MNNLANLTEAYYFAAKKHTKQKRKGNDAAPYINHPIEVVKLLTNIGSVEDFDILIAAVLHDTVEDTETTVEEVSEKYGANVGVMVSDLTDDQTLSKKEQREAQVEHAPHISDGAKQVKLCDKISNIRDVLENPPDGWSDERRLEYINWGERVVAGLRGANADLENHFDELLKKAKEKIKL